MTAIGIGVPRLLAAASSLFSPTYLGQLGRAALGRSLAFRGKPRTEYPVQTRLPAVRIGSASFKIRHPHLQLTRTWRMARASSDCRGVGLQSSSVAIMVLNEM